MKIGILSDTHLNRINISFVQFYEKRLSEMDMILHAGDFVSEEVLNFLAKGLFHGVQGNMDLDDIRLRLPAKKVIEIEKFRIGLIHGWGSKEDLEDRIIREFDDVDAIIYGHSHRPANHIRKGVLLFNPGTASGYTSGGFNSFGVLEVGDTLSGEIREI